MNALKSAGMVFLGIAAFIAILILALVFLYGVVWVSAQIYDYVIDGALIALAVCIFILTPLSFFHKTRIVPIYGFLVCSVVFGLCTWILGLLTAYIYWGIGGIFIGLSLGGIGVVPIGILAALFHPDWGTALVLVVGLVLTFGARGIAFWLGHIEDRAEEKRRLKIIESEVAR
jgi:hypothetical protein